MSEGGKGGREEGKEGGREEGVSEGGREGEREGRIGKGVCRRGREERRERNMISNLHELQVYCTRSSVVSDSNSLLPFITTPAQPLLCLLGRRAFPPLPVSTGSHPGLVLPTWWCINGGRGKEEGWSGCVEFVVPTIARGCILELNGSNEHSCEVIRHSDTIFILCPVMDIHVILVVR